MGTFYIRKGKDIKLKGAAEKRIVPFSVPSRVAIQPPDFTGFKARVLAKEGDLVKVGSPLLEDKQAPEVKVASPVSGKVIAIVRGEKRALLQVIIEADGRQEAHLFHKYSSGEIRSLNRETVVKQLLEGGLWPVIRQRPFTKIAHHHDSPKSIFVHAMNTEPLAADIDFVLEGRENDFQAGLNALGRLTKGEVHLCVDLKAKSKALTQSQNVQIHKFSGPHPTGNISTHIHYVDPVKKGDIVWFVEAQDVLRIGKLFVDGVSSGERIVAVTGEGAENRVYAKTIIGASIHSLLGGKLKAEMRYISGSIFKGMDAGHNGFLGYYDSQITVIPEGGKRQLLGWLTPGFGVYSLSKTFASSFLPERPVTLDTDTHGSHRAIVMNHVYDAYVTIDVMTFFLLRAVISGDIEEAERLGILECDEEDFALCSFACPSKTDVGAIIRQGLDVIDREG